MSNIQGRLLDSCWRCGATGQPMYEMKQPHPSVRARLDADPRPWPYKVPFPPGHTYACEDYIACMKRAGKPAGLELKEEYL